MRLLDAERLALQYGLVSVINVDNPLDDARGVYEASTEEEDAGSIFGLFACLKLRDWLVTDVEDLSLSLPKLQDAVRVRGARVMAVLVTEALEERAPPTTIADFLIGREEIDSSALRFLEGRGRRGVDAGA